MMLCEHCYHRKASVTISQMINGESKELNLCESCADELGLKNKITNLPQIFTGMMLDILKYKEKESGLPVHHKLTERCPFCGYSWDKFKHTGFLGCDKCYLAFYQQIKQVLERVHGNSRHIGNRPGESSSSIDQNIMLLEKALQETVKKEEYEKAAELRDKIRSLKQKTEKDNIQNHSIRKRSR